jgi:16S rRNA G1207 methylase RsmC
MMHHAMDDREYYAWQSTEVSTRSGTYALFEKPGMARFGRQDIAALLLADELDAGPADALLLLNCGAGLPGLVAAGAGARVIMTDANVVAVQAARHAAEANGLADRVEVAASGGTREVLSDMTVDIAALLLPKGKAAALQHIWDAYCALRPGGRFYIAGANAEGAKPTSAMPKISSAQSRCVPIARAAGSAWP